MTHNSAVGADLFRTPLGSKAVGPLAHLSSLTEVSMQRRNQAYNNRSTALQEAISVRAASIQLDSA